MFIKTTKRKKKVIVAMSGGVDSSVAAALLVKKGYECIGIYMNFWHEAFIPTGKDVNNLPQNKCCSIESLENARRIAYKLNIPFYVLNARDKFKEKVVDYFINTYKICQTPNPCIECNRYIKFGFLFKRMKELRADYIATGHFARIKRHNGIYDLLMAKDKLKDQSYFLYTLNQEKLKHILFPIGEMNKKKIKKIAKKFGFKNTADRKESQGICFFAEKEPTDFLKRNLPLNSIRPGPIKTTKGEIVGKHKGLQFFTVGQRKGIEIGGQKEPFYVVKLDYENNTLIVGKDHEVFRKKFNVFNLTFVHKDFTDGEHIIEARIRYRFPPKKAIFKKNGDTGEIIFQEPQRAITPGQSVVFYKGDKVLGGGIIQLCD
jgi:tRNA-specific 2-thiouridylase